MSPERFQDELDVRLPGYRLIRSLSSPRWRIEYKVTRALDYAASDDRARMIRDGHALAIDTPDSPFLPCPTCDNPISLPVFEKAEFDCPLCVSHGKRKRMVDGYFPLVERTLLYLERYHPRRGAAIAAEIAAENRANDMEKLRATRNLAEDLALDAWGRISNASQFGYTKTGTPHVWGRD